MSLDELPGLAAEVAGRLDYKVDPGKIDNISGSTVAELFNRYYWVRVPRGSSAA